MEEFTAVLEVRDNGHWSPSAPITLKGADGDTAREVALDFLAQRQPRGQFRLRVWPGSQVDLFTDPAVTIGPSDVQRDPAPARVLRAGRRYHRTRVSGPASQVVHRVRLDEVPLGSAILVTDDPRNTAATECEGPWYPAAHTDGAVRATVKQANYQFAGRHTMVAVDLVLSVGEMRGLKPDRSVPLA